MRECNPYTKNVAENLKNLNKVKDDLEYALDMCREVISMAESELGCHCCEGSQFFSRVAEGFTEYLLLVFEYSYFG